MEEFLKKENVIAVVGVSNDTKKWGRKIYEKLKTSGFYVYPVNPKYGRIGNDICYPDLNSLPMKPDVVITVVKPAITEKIVRSAKALGIRMVWMQPGSESEEAIKFCEENNIKVVYNVCFVVDGLKGAWKE